MKVFLKRFDRQKPQQLNSISWGEKPYFHSYCKKNNPFHYKISTATTSIINFSINIITFDKIYRRNKIA